MEEIRSDEWFKKDYVPARHYENEDVNLDDVHAVFDEPEVTILILPFQQEKINLSEEMLDFIASPFFKCFYYANCVSNFFICLNYFLFSATAIGLSSLLVGWNICL